LTQGDPTRTTTTRAQQHLPIAKQNSAQVQQAAAHKSEREASKLNERERAPQFQQERERSDARSFRSVFGEQCR